MNNERAIDILTDRFLGRFSREYQQKNLHERCTSNMSGHGHGYTAGCEVCKKVERKYSKLHHCENLFLVHTHRSIIKGKTKKEKADKKKLLQKIEKLVAALRNCEGGRLIVHLQGQEERDRYLEFFDEFISKRFGDFIEDGHLYVDTYSRGWLCELSHFEQYTDFVCFSIKKANAIVTVDFNTKICNDVEKLHPSSLTVQTLMNKRPTANTVLPWIRGIPNDLQILHESRNIELKAFLPGAEKYDQLTRNTTDFVEYVWSDLKLKDNITALSKVAAGGSYYVGIGEKVTKGYYETKIPEITGFEIHAETSDLSRGLFEKVKETVCVLNQGEFLEAPPDLIAVAFHPLPIAETQSQRYVLEVAIRYFDGIVFSDKNGPRTYTIVNGETVRLGKLEWLRRLKQES